MEHEIRDWNITQACNIAVNNEKRVYETDFPIPDLANFFRERDDMIIV